MLGEMTKCDPDNIIHTAKITRLGELHRNKAESYNNKLKSEIRQAKHEVNNDKKSGIKHISKPSVDQEPNHQTACIVIVTLQMEEKLER